MKQGTEGFSIAYRNPIGQPWVLPFHESTHAKTLAGLECFHDLLFTHQVERDIRRAAAGVRLHDDGKTQPPRGGSCFITGVDQLVLGHG